MTTRVRALLFLAVCVESSAFARTLPRTVTKPLRPATNAAAVAPARSKPAVAMVGGLGTVGTKALAVKGAGLSLALGLRGGGLDLVSLHYRGMDHCIF